jgi:hypothetical protein
MKSTKDNTGMYCIYSNGELVLEKNIYFEEHQLIHKKGFISLAINDF